MSKQSYTVSELKELAERHGIEIRSDPPKPKKPDPDIGIADLRRAIEKRNRKTSPKGKSVTSAASSELQKPRVHYVDDKGREWSPRTGEWVERSDSYWQLEARYGGLAKVLEVSDLDGPTVIDHPQYGRIVTRGCLVCGFKLIARPASPVRFGRWRGSLCPQHHRSWETLSVPERKQLGLFTVRALYDADRLPDNYPTERGGHPVTRFPQNWKRFTWGYRVLTSDHPEIQQPVSEPFGYLRPGPIPFAEGAEPEEVTV